MKYNVFTVYHSTVITHEILSSFVNLVNDVVLTLASRKIEQVILWVLLVVSQTEVLHMYMTVATCP